MLEITNWTEYDLDAVYPVELCRLALPVFSPMLNDFRTPEQMRRDAAASEASATLQKTGWWLPVP